MLPEAQLYHYKARVYDPALGRFLQTDPVGYSEGLNLYLYGDADPVNVIDPYGLTECRIDPEVCRVVERDLEELRRQLNELREGLESIKRKRSEGTDLSEEEQALVDQFEEMFGRRLTSRTLDQTLRRIDIAQDFLAPDGAAVIRMGASWEYDDNDRAFVRNSVGTYDPNSIYLTPYYFDLRAQNIRTGALFHEVAHLRWFANDYAYFHQTDRWARLTPAQRWINADSWRCFAIAC